MTDAILTEKKIVTEKNIEELKKDLLHVGNCNDKEAGWQVMGAMEPYFTGDTSVESTSFKRKLRMAFPTSRELPRMYAYAIRHPVLLPLAWIHRACRYFTNWFLHRDESYNVTEKLTVAEHRLYMMKSLGLDEY
jgi:hypothetical protein